MSTASKALASASFDGRRNQPGWVGLALGAQKVHDRSHPARPPGRRLLKLLTATPLRVSDKDSVYYGKERFADRI